MLYNTVNQRIELRIIDRAHGEELFQLIDSNREYLQRWHPWVDGVRSVCEAAKIIAGWQQMYAQNRGMFAGIWFDGRCCGMVNHQTVDWSNRWSALSYWLGATCQGQGIMTDCCRSTILHAFQVWKLNRVTIECATENIRSRGVAERLGFKLEGVVRGIEWLGDHYVDHSMYGLLNADCVNGQLPKVEPRCQFEKGIRASKDGSLNSLADKAQPGARRSETILTA